MRDQRPGPAARLAAWVLAALWSRDATEALVGDLDEEYMTWMRPRLGALRAELWYVRQIVGAAAHLSGVVLERRNRGRGGGVGMRGGWGLDIRYAVRGLVRRPLLTIGVVATFALGIGVNVALFSVADAVVFGELPYRDADRLVRVRPDRLFYADREQIEWMQEHATSFAELAGWGRAIFTFEREGEAEEVRGARVQWNDFRMLGVEPFLGRTFLEEDATGSGSDAVLLSHALWVRSFGADPSVVGSTVSVGGTAVRIIGVLSPDHQPIEEDWEAWGPLNTDPGNAHSEYAMAFNARLRDGATIAQAQTEMRALFQEYATDVRGAPMSEEDVRAISVVPLRTFLMAGADRLLLPALLAVALVLLVACGNLSNLILAHGRARAHEMAIRRAIGAGGARLGRLVVTEAWLLATLGGGAGLLVGWATLEAFRSSLPEVLPRTRAIAFDGRVVLFAVAATAVAALLSWAGPVIQSSRTRAVSFLREGRAEPARSLSASTLLVTGQVALTVVLVGAATLTLRSWISLSSQDPGFRAESVVTFRPRFPSSRFTPDEQATLHEQIIDRLAATPNVQAVGTILFMPMHSGGAYTAVWRAEDEPLSDPNVSLRMVSEGYFDAMGIRLLEGRGIASSDRPETEAVVVLNRTAADQIFPDDSSLGRVVLAGGDGVPRRVVGVIEDVRQSGLADEAMAEVYYPVRQVPSPRRAYAVRVAGDPADALARIEAAVHDVEPTTALMDFAPLEEVVGSSVSRPRFFTSLLSFFGATALALGIVGIWGVTAHAVRRARRDLGIRIALGATDATLIRQLTTRALFPVLIGTVVGLAAFTFIGRIFSGFLYGVEPDDPATLAVVPLILLVTGVLATVGPALRTRTLDPARILREE